MRTTAIGLLLLLVACGSQQSREPTLADLDIVARDDSFALVRLKSGQDERDLARIFLGHPGQHWQIREVNAGVDAEVGEIVAVPLVPVNSSSVYTDGFRTLPILCYHQFTNADEASHQLELSAAAFEEQLRYLIDNDFVLLSFADVERILREGQPIPERSAVITIDDGYRSVYDVAWPILKKYRAPATLFIYTDFIGAPAAMSWEQLREMADSGFIEVESHAKSHASLSRLVDDKDKANYSRRVRDEIVGSNKAFERHMGQVPSYLSYPYGNSSDTAARIAGEEGMALAATVTRGDNTVYADPYLLHRSMIYDSHSMSDFRKLLRVYRKQDLR